MKTKQGIKNEAISVLQSKTSTVMEKFVRACSLIFNKPEKKEEESVVSLIRETLNILIGVETGHYHHK